MRKLNVAIVGATGVDAEAGVTNVNLPEAEVKRRMVASAARSILVADSTKLGHVHLGRVASLDELDELITDDSAPTEHVGALRAAGLPVSLVRVRAH